MIIYYHSIYFNVNIVVHSLIFCFFINFFDMAYAQQFRVNDVEFNERVLQLLNNDEKDESDDTFDDSDADPD